MVLFKTFNRRIELTSIAYTYYVRCLFTCLEALSSGLTNMM